MVYGMIAGMVFTSEKKTQKIRYAAVGDSYTIGEGVEESQRWPNVLTKHLREKGLDIELAANPSQTGWTTRDALEKEMPAYREADPNFATLLIGVNDWVQGVEDTVFRKNLGLLMDKMLAVLPSKEYLIVLTIPDFSVTPVGPRYARGRDISRGIQAFNAIIQEEAENRGLTVVDLYPVSKKMKDDSSLVADDGLHPSAKEYEEWEKLIFPIAYKILNRNV